MHRLLLPSIIFICLPRHERDPMHPDNSQDSFAQMMDDVKPLKHQQDKIVGRNQSTKDNANKDNVNKANRRLAAANNLADKLSSSCLVAVAPEQYLEYCQPNFNKQHFRKLARGECPCHYTLDLHGLTVKKAYQAVNNTVKTQSGCVLIIHGKARRRHNQETVHQDAHDTMGHIKSHVNHWLPQWPQVLAFCSATANHGGTGAVYVWLGGVN